MQAKNLAAHSADNFKFTAGKNDNLAWGSSFSFVDDQDLYFEKLNPQNRHANFLRIIKKKIKNTI